MSNKKIIKIACKHTKKNKEINVINKGTIC